MLLTTSGSIQDKLAILTDAAKYDVACTSSGVERHGSGSGMGNSISSGICHSFSSDGRCISLLKILMTNECIFNCAYCQNNCNQDLPRATFTPQEICQLTMEFYRRNYIEGLFLSSGIIISPTHTMSLIYQTLYQLRQVHHFQGYIHVKAIPGADPELIRLTGYLADRMSVNLELPTAASLKNLAPCKSRKTILTPMRLIQNGIAADRQEVVPYHSPATFVPAGQSTQMIIGATPEHDYEIMSVAQELYQRFGLKRVFYSAFINVTQLPLASNTIGHSSMNIALPGLPAGPPLLREHRLYQTDWLLRYYHFTVAELLDETHPDLNIFLDPKCDWAIRHLDLFPVEIQTASYYTLLRVPGIGYQSARRIVQARRTHTLDFSHLKKIGVVLKRALYFITCSGHMMYHTPMDEDYICRQLLSDHTMIPREIRNSDYKQLSLFDLYSA